MKPNSSLPPELPRIKPRLREGARIQDRPTGGGHDVLLYPEGVEFLDATRRAIVGLCDGQRDLGRIVARLCEATGQVPEVIWPDLAGYLLELYDLTIVALEPNEAAVLARSIEPVQPEFASSAEDERAREHPGPLGLQAELTHRCPLRCPYCSNPTDARPAGEELGTSEWRRVFEEAAGLGVLHALLTGGEPMLRGDLPELVASARSAGLYTNLITSGVGLSHDRAGELRRAGLDSVQISLQADEALEADEIAGARVHAAKLRAIRAVKELGLPLTLNVVLHLRNIDRVGRVIALAEELGAQRLELASAQYLGWAWRNRDALIPHESQVREAERVAALAADRLRGRMIVVYVWPDYFTGRPKPCLGGWGRRYLTVDPAGRAMPCPTAGSIPGLRFENVRERPLAGIWADSDAFQRFRGTSWMREPCRSCPLREVDFGGCRCQASLLVGDPAATDPACSLAPGRSRLEAARTVDPANAAVPFLYRTNPPA